MTVSLVLAIIICLVALVITLTLTKIEDKNYDSNKSIANLTMIYIVFLPVIFVLVGIVWFFT